MRKQFYFKSVVGVQARLIVALSIAVGSAFAAGGGKGGDDVEALIAKMRETLRNNMIELRNVQNERAVLQTTTEEQEAKIKELTAKLELATKQAAADKNAATNQIAELTEKLQAAEAKIAEVESANANWKKAFNDAAQLAEKKETERARLAAVNKRLEADLDHHISKNIEMYRVAMELLERYRKFSLGDALLAREQFTGLSKVQLQNLMQDYENRLAEQRVIKPKKKPTDPTPPSRSAQ